MEMFITSALVLSVLMLAAESKPSVHASLIYIRSLIVPSNLQNLRSLLMLH
jgi:hypothetical protein